MDIARHVPDTERRARLAVRHALHPDHRVADTAAATRAMTVLHATEPASVHLAVAARTDDVTPADVDYAMYRERTVVKQLAMRRTLFVFPRDLLPAAWGSAAARTATSERTRLVKNVEAAGLAGDGSAWLDERADEVLTVLGEHGALGAQQIREAVPSIDVKVSASASEKWGGPIPLAPRLLGWMGADGQIVRGENAGHWRTSRAQWTPMTSWLGAPPVPLESAAGYAELVRRWLFTFGPGTEDDVVWWLGGTKSAVRAALAEVDAVPVGLDDGSTGWLLPDDLDTVADPGPWVALLPVLDPTTMGWKQRDFHLDPALRPFLFDTNGNGGTTAWVDGRIVGAWTQDDDARVCVHLHAGVSPADRAALDIEAARLTDFLDGDVVSSVYKSRLMKGEPLP